MVHPARQLARDATATPGMKVLERDGLDRLKTAVRAFATGSRPPGGTALGMAGLLTGHGLRSGDLASYLRDYPPSQ